MLEKYADDDDNDGDDEYNDYGDDGNEGCSKNIDYLVDFFSKNHKGRKDNRLYSRHTVSSNKRQVKEHKFSNAN